MITYDQGHWGLLYAFKLHGSVFPKSLCWSCPSALLSILLHQYLHSNPDIRDVFVAGDIGASVLSGFTFILGFLIVFRSQQAYARWWEGGTLLQQLRGEWFNAFSALMAFCNTKKEKRAEVVQFQHRLVRLVSLLYASALEQVTTIHDPHLEVIALEGFELEQFVFMSTAHDRCEVVLQWLQRLIVEADSTEIIKVAPPILSRVYNQLGNGIVNLNNARKITDFPIPFPLAQMVTFMLLFHFMITTIVCAASVQTSAWAGFLSFLVVFSFWSINYIAIELEMPFGDDPNDLPLQEMQTDLNKSLVQLMQKSAQTCPSFVFNPVHRRFKTTETHLDEYLEELKPDLFSPKLAPSQQDQEVPFRRSSSLTELRKQIGDRKISKRMASAQRYTSQLKDKRSARKSGALALPFANVLNVLKPHHDEEEDDEDQSKDKELGTKYLQDYPDENCASPPYNEVSPVRVDHVAVPVQVEPSPPPKEPKSTVQSVQGRSTSSHSDASPLPGFGSVDSPGVDVIWLSKRMEDHLHKIANELQALREPRELQSSMRPGTLAQPSVGSAGSPFPAVLGQHHLCL